ncbi:bifunctional diguanylate cyclase/phosphodiesterase [Caballeronia mineralivorans]|jgi:diguanylate cyclase (GGDEF)-like protein|uniref:putative bifunctional diguanylate cyclase/phosphodiesterase n=1 Tax=Caballeronia mineralivorans TaxID=2010198 RepID=UPI0023F58399|nr:bifunctional diguanylate cyclase/phosphodiesterase [Caballeronia mineralivorans]MDB5786003.1 Bifunctional diguanylate cyclase/phosphodiesterase [Caballeronia mineralivorans]
MYATSYNSLLVFFSLLVAIFASYTALNLASRIATARGRVARLWLAGGAFAMGVGIWSMHFVGMLAFSLPVALGYDPVITMLSLLIAIATSGFALWLVCQATLPWARLGCGALLMGMAVAGMHYTGMAATRMTPAIQYSPAPFALSVVIAVAASGAALWIAFHLRRQTTHGRLPRAGAAVVMGAAITGMHYTGMAAARFPVGSVCGAARDGMSSDWLALPVIVVTVAVLAVALIVCVLDTRLEARTALLAESLAQANAELTFLALHDRLTQLPNRILLEDRLVQAIHAARRERRRFALMYLDLDGFKAVNDAFGHPVGDLLLAEVARRLRAAVRGEDTVARVGGDEFVVLADAIGPADAATLADKLVGVVAEPYDIAGHDVRVSASVGIACYPDDGADPHALITHADAAMYHAKALGRNGYCFFEMSMNANAHEQLELLHDLRVALVRGELVLHYQPKFTAPSGPVTGAEALVRWMHPRRGLILPDEFIPLAERTGMIVPIGLWVLDEACRQMAQWRNTGPAGVRDWGIAVNVSALQFNHPGLVASVHATLLRHGLDPGCLTLEITESTAMRDAEASLAILRELHDMGVRIAIDGFGTGYSSLLYLKRLPAAELKIDRGFVRDLVQNSEDAAIVSAIVALGQTLKLNIVAEGVETAGQQAFLTRLGCDVLQGFLLGRPMPPAQLIETLSRQKTGVKPTD